MSKILMCILLSFSVAMAKSPWAKMTKQDLNFIHKTLKDNHPGAVDEENPSFNQWLNQGYKKSLNMSKQADSMYAYFFALQHYVNGFHDNHLSLSDIMKALFDGSNIAF